MPKFLYHKLVKDRQSCILPSSTTTAMFPSGERPTHVMFFVVETGKVSDVLLEERNEEINVALTVMLMMVNLHLGYHQVSPSCIIYIVSLLQLDLQAGLQHSIQVSYNARLY